MNTVHCGDEIISISFKKTTLGSQWFWLKDKNIAWPE